MFSAVIFSVSPLMSHADEFDQEASGEYRVGPDDVLKITVYREEELTRSLRVSVNGNITFPLIDELKVEGLTVSELEKTLETKLSRYLKKPQVTVFIEGYATVTVTGQVNEPGSFPLKGRLTVLEVIGMAKGFTKIAGQNDVKVMRTEDGEKKTIRVKVAEISRKGNISEDVELKRGDIIYVPESLF